MPASLPRRPPRRAKLAPLLALLASSVALAQPSPPPATEATAPAPQGVDAGSPTATLLNAADDIARQIVALRGLQERHPIQRGVLSRDAIGRHLQARLDREYTPDEVRVEAMMLKRLGLLPDDADYRELLVSLLMEQVAGFYDPDAKKLYIADWLDLAMQRPTLAHELEHALQDQHFDLQRFARPIKDNGDEQLARSALAEGDGMVVMMEFVSRSMGLDLAQVANMTPNLMESVGKQLAAGAIDQSPEFSKAPRFLRETLLFPYFSGMQFVFALRQAQPPQQTAKKPSPQGEDRGWARVDEAFRKPPASTEQVLHPEKYLAGEAPVRVTAAAPRALAPLVALREDVLGEQMMRVLLGSQLDQGVAERAAAGWGGDRLVVYGLPPEKTKPDDTAGSAVTVVDLSVWDTEQDAREVEAALRELLARQTGHTDRLKELFFVKDGRVWAVERRGAQVVAMFGAPEGVRQALTDEVYSTWRVATPTPKAAKTGTAKAAKRANRAGAHPSKPSSAPHPTR